MCVGSLVFCITSFLSVFAGKYVACKNVGVFLCFKSSLLKKGETGHFGRSEGEREFPCFVNWHLCGTLNIAQACEHTAEYCDCSEATALYLVKGDQPLSLFLLLNVALSPLLSVAELKRSLRGGLNSEPSFFFPFFLSLLPCLSRLIVL